MATGKWDQTACSRRVRRASRRLALGLHGEATGANGGLCVCSLGPFLLCRAAGGSPSHPASPRLPGIADPLGSSPLAAGRGSPRSPRQGRPPAAPSRGPAMPGPPLSSSPPPPRAPPLPRSREGRVGAGPRCSPGPGPPGGAGRAGGCARGLGAGARPGRAGGIRAALAGRGHGAGGEVRAAPGPACATGGAASLRAPGREGWPGGGGSWRRAGPANLARGLGRPVPDLEIPVINGPQPLAICLHVQSPNDQETLEALARLPELPAAELTGHRGGGCGCGPGRRVRGNETESRRRGCKLAAPG